MHTQVGSCKPGEMSTLGCSESLLVLQESVETVLSQRGPKRYVWELFTLPIQTRILSKHLYTTCTYPSEDFILHQK